MIPSALSTSSIQAGSLRQAPFDRLPSTGSLRQAQGRQGRQGRQDFCGGWCFAGVAGATPCGSRQLRPLWCEHQPAKSALLRRLRRLAKLIYSRQYLAFREGDWIDDPFGFAQDRFSIDYFRFYIYYFRVTPFDKLRTAKRRGRFR